MLHQFRDTVRVQRRTPDGTWPEVAYVRCRVVNHRSAAYLPLDSDVAVGDIATFPDAERFEILAVTAHTFAQRVRMRNIMSYGSSPG